MHLFGKESGLLSARIYSLLSHPISAPFHFQGDNIRSFYSEIVAHFIVRRFEDIFSHTRAKAFSD